jgi:hypothetical protein
LFDIPTIMQLPNPLTRGASSLRILPNLFKIPDHVSESKNKGHR